MHTFLWIVQGVLVLKLLTAASTHGARHGEPALGHGVESMGRTAKPVLVGSSIMMLVGALGLLTPLVLHVPPWVVPSAASGLAALQLISVVFHLRCREDPNLYLAVVLFALAALVAIGRSTLAPL